MEIGLFCRKCGRKEIDDLSPDEIAYLIETESWKGKAGSYDLAVKWVSTHG